MIFRKGCDEVCRKARNNILTFFTKQISDHKMKKLQHIKTIGIQILKNEYSILIPRSSQVKMSTTDKMKIRVSSLPASLRGTIATLKLDRYGDGALDEEEFAVAVDSFANETKDNFKLKKKLGRYVPFLFFLLNLFRYIFIHTAPKYCSSCSSASVSVCCGGCGFCCACCFCRPPACLAIYSITQEEEEEEEEDYIIIVVQ